VARYLGLDIGDKHIGVALSDPGGILATPFTIIECHETRTDMAAIVKIIDEKQVEKVIVGLPRSMSGNIGKQAEKVQDFVRQLSTLTLVPMAFRDERLSTVSARRLMRELGKSRKDRDDAIAAAIILQVYLEELYDSRPQTL